MTMIEKVAAAILKADHSSRRDQAKAAIEAMREPTDEMIAAGHGWYDTKESWQQMIDVALKED